MLGWGRRAAPSGPGRRQGEAPCNSLVSSAWCLGQWRGCRSRCSRYVSRLSQREGRERWCWTVVYDPARARLLVWCGSPISVALPVVPDAISLSAMAPADFC